MELLLTITLLFGPIVQQDAWDLSRTAITCEVSEWKGGKLQYAENCRRH